MDRRVFILPVMSVFLVMVLFLDPGITGFMVADSFENQITADIRITISQDGFIPEDSTITVYLGGQESSMDFKDFVQKTGKSSKLITGEIPEIGYEGQGFGGEFTYSLDISEFDIDTNLEPGEHTLTVEVSHENYVISQTFQKIEI